MTKDKSPKACIHYTESLKLRLHKATATEMKKGSQGAIVKGVIDWLETTTVPKELKTHILKYMPTQQTEAMKTASALKRAVSKATTPQEKKQASLEFVNSLDAETKKLLGL
jgi:hypothetical protein|tara:strand:+ start:329 stop:661 length:333 start_codon:yes stop_codon:yes gene_type:complete